MKEFLPNSRISFSLLAGVGLDTGSDKGEISKNGFSYTDKLSGKHGSLGGSLNLNFEARELKIQPYISGTLIQGSADYSLEYSRPNATTNITKIQYKNTINQTDLGAGIRFIDPKVDMLSYFSMNYAASLKKSGSTSSSFNDQTVVLSNTSNAEIRPLTFQIGFGFSF